MIFFFLGRDPLFLWGNWNLGYFSDENDDDFEVGNFRIISGPEDESGTTLLLLEVMGNWFE